MSPTAPTVVTLNGQLNKAHRRIRELEADKAALLAQHRALCAVITELTHHDHACTAADLSSDALHTPSPGDGSDVRLGVGDLVGVPTSQHLGPAVQSPPPAIAPVPAPASRTEANRVKTRRFPYV